MISAYRPVVPRLLGLTMKPAPMSGLQEFQERL
jgi:hypothetical protein